MKILFTGGGSGGHFYPIIAIAQELNKIVKAHKIFGVELYFMSPEPYNQGILFENNITFKKNRAGKIRRYFSLLNFFDIFKTIWGVFTAVGSVFTIYPDVVFGKGGYASFPALLAARILRIPIIIHESDTVPGKVNIWAGKFAQRIAVSYKEAAAYFPKDKVAYTGNPVRRSIIEPQRAGAFDYFKLQEGLPVILVLGGSLGARLINAAVIDALPELVEKYQVIHQTGRANFKEVQETTDVVLLNNPRRNRYKIVDYLGDLQMKMAAGVSSIVISRTGSTIFEIAAWRIPSIIIPIADSHGDHQRKNAFSYARSGAAVVVEEQNISATIIISEIEKILSDSAVRDKMATAAKDFFRPNAAKTIAEEILSIALGHEG